VLIVFRVRRLRVKGFRFQVSAQPPAAIQINGVREAASLIDKKIKNVEHRTSNIQHPTSTTNCPCRFGKRLTMNSLHSEIRQAAFVGAA
jgi:hypothetical protein